MPGVETTVQEIPPAVGLLRRDQLPAGSPDLFSRSNPGMLAILKIRLYMDSGATVTRRDVFICHASEDKNSVARPLVNELSGAGISVWYDEAEIAWGDSVSKRINEGLAISSFVIVVLTRNFIRKNWTQAELSAALHMEIQSQKTKILPLICGDEKDQRAIFDQYPLLKDKHYLLWKNVPSELTAALRMLLARSAKETAAEVNVETAKHAVARQKEIEQLVERLISSSTVPVKFQPVYELKTGQMVGLEATCSLFHSTDGPITHLEIASAATRIGFADQFADMYLSSAFEQIKGWLSDRREIPRIGINVCEYELRQSSFVEKLTTLMQRAQVSPMQIELAIREADIALLLDNACDVVTDARALGISIAVKNFGSGYTSLSYLRQGIFKRLIMDPQFMEELGINAGTSTLVETIIVMCKALGCVPVAEGVTTQIQLNLLREMSCAEAQGAILAPLASGSQIATHYLPQRPLSSAITFKVVPPIANSQG